MYFFLLCRMSEPPQPGSYRLRDWDRHPTWARSATQKCLATACKYERLQYFARYLAENDLPWEKRQVLESLQELYNKGIIVVEGDMLVQPRMYQDNGFQLPDIDGDGDPKNTILDDPASGSMEVADGDSPAGENKGAISGTIKGTKKVPENDTVSRARARLSKRVGVGDNNNNKNNSKEDSTREGEKSAAKKPAKFTPPTQEEVTAYCKEKGYTFNPVKFFAYYETNGWVQGKGKPIKSWKACCVTWQQREQEGEFANRSQRSGKPNDTVQQHHDGGFDDMEGFG